jgi:aryl-alcohol dehydrogenase-like predicted oxidoreductase
MSLIWGTMRMLAHTQEPAFWVDFFRDLHQRGINTLHSSLEYDSFPLLCEVLRRLRKDGITFRHMVKLAEPSFADTDFSPNRLLAKLQAYQHLLGTDCIHHVQWMWRSDLQHETNRVVTFTQQHADIHSAFAHLKSTGQAQQITCFPYTPGFADATLAIPSLDGLTVYWNPQEQDYLPQMQACVQHRKQVYTLRPFGAGQLHNTTSAELLDFTFHTQLVTATVFTATRPAHLDQVLAHMTAQNVPCPS